MSASSRLTATTARRGWRGCSRAEARAGEVFSYDNHAFATAGQLIEDIAGEPFPVWMSNNLFRPLGMANSSYANAELGRAPGYTCFDGSLYELAPYEIVTLGAAVTDDVGT